ncbi:LAMI_0F02344g1_1 [Lachancea mirantina]|uniref:LAMI_0F02344g1_1 n=1 Tax=Lachancea mirantina TaxID=1230905 RepID=A0A1G4JWF9_9SACH|nr:LAMI_0F02344g1_1 [Lachancea mirantina]
MHSGRLKARRIGTFLKKQFPCNRILVQRIFKSTVHATVALILCLIPKVRDRIGNQPAMLPLIAVMVHPGRRVSATIQGAMYAITGLLTGLAYSLFGRFLAQRCLGSTWSILSETEQYEFHYKRYESALAILAVFETLMLFFHGWMRSVSHHYFGIVFPLFLVVHFAFMAPLEQNAATVAKAFSVPFYLGIGMSLFWNLVLFPEFGSTYLGNATVDVLNEVHKAFDSSISYFITLSADQSNSLYSHGSTSLATLLKLKDTVDKKVSNCCSVLDECIYEISYSYVSPTDLRPMFGDLKNLSLYINALVNACQLQFVLVHGMEKDMKEKTHLYSLTEKEIVHADVHRLVSVLNKLKVPIFDLHKKLSDALYVIKLAIAYTQDVNLKEVLESPLSSSPSPELTERTNVSDLDFEEHINRLMDASISFDLRFREEMIQLNVDLLTPKDEMFLLSSFLMNFKEVTNSVVEIMRVTKKIYETRKQREAKGWIRGKSVWINFLTNYEDFKKWFRGSMRSQTITEGQSLTGGVTGNNYRPPGDMAVIRPQNEEEEMLGQQSSNTVELDREYESVSLPLTSNHMNISNQRNKSAVPATRSYGTRVKKNSSRALRKTLIFFNKFYVRCREHFRFGLQVTIALMLASFPMFIPKARKWYMNIRGTWVGFVCILALEPSVGGTFWVFFLRGVGVIIGAAWGYLSYVAGVKQTNPYLEVIITIFGAVPGFYFLLGSPYVKAAIIQIISIYIVMLAAILPSDIQGSILSNFAKRCLAVGYGGGIAVFVQFTLFPIKARDQLNEEIAFVTGCISEMERLVATGLEGEAFNPILLERNFKRHSELSEGAKAALGRASVYKGLTRQEPRLKGNYTELEEVFTQIIFVQRQIIDRMDNIKLLRKQHGSAIAEELNHVLYPYRRQFVASVNCSMRAVQEAIINKTPLPHFLPSARISHRRLVNKVRETLKVRYRGQITSLNPRKMVDVFQQDEPSGNSEFEEGLEMKPKARPRFSLPPHDYITKEKFLAWNATSAATEEVVEYIEELVQLTKILVGVNEFKYGFLSRPLYEDWAAEAAVDFQDFVKKRNTTTHDIESQNSRPLSSIRSSDQEGSDDSLEQDEPVALNEAPDFDSSGKNTISKTLRNRAFSIASRVSSNNKSGNNLNKTQTLGDTETRDEIEPDSETELPLALKRVLSRRRQH